MISPLPNAALNVLVTSGVPRAKSRMPMQRTTIRIGRRGALCFFITFTLFLSEFGAFGQTLAEKGALEKRGLEGDSSAQAQLAIVHLSGLGVAKPDCMKAAKWSRLAAEQGHAVGLYVLACLYKDGMGVPKDSQKAASLYAQCLPGLRRLAEGGSATAQCCLGIMLEQGYGGLTPDLETAVLWYRRSAEGGCPRGQSHYADCLHKGMGVEKDLAEAVRWATLAAEQGLCTAQRALGVFFLGGEGVEQDTDQTLELCQRAAAKGDPSAHTVLGFLHTRGWSVKRNHHKAMAYYEQARELGDPEGDYRIGVAYLNGQGVKRDYAEALRLFLQAKEKGYEKGDDTIRCVQRKIERAEAYRRLSSRPEYQNGNYSNSVAVSLSPQDRFIKVVFQPLGPGLLRGNFSWGKFP